MKNYSKTLSGVFFCLLMISCQKNRSDPLNSVSQQIVDESQSSIAAFVKLAHNGKSNPVAGLRTTNVYTPSQALYYLNHGLNYAYCRPDENYAETIMVSDTLFIPLVDTATLVSEDSLIVLFEQIAEMAGDLYHGESDTTKQPFNFEIRPFGDIEEDYIPVIATFTMGKGSCSNLNSYSYGSTDQWEVFPEAGNCYLNTSENDAMDHWRCDLNANLNYRNKFIAYYFSNRYSVVFSSLSGAEAGYELEYMPYNLLVDHEELLNPNDPTESDNYYDYLLFYNHENKPDYHSCLSQAEMNWYYEEMASLSIDYCPQGKVTGLHGVGMDLLPIGYSIIGNVMRVDYYTRNLIELEEDYPALELPTSCC